MLALLRMTGANALGAMRTPALRDSKVLGAWVSCVLWFC